MSVEDTVLVPKLELAAPRRDRVFPQSFARQPATPRYWPWVVAAVIVIVGALVDPLVPLDRQVRLSSTAQQLRQALSAR
jgi:hypothetical protein